MKRFVLPLLFVLSFSATQAQCPLVFGDFEDWFDQTELINQDFGKEFEPGTFLVPNYMVSFFRLFSMLFIYDIPVLMDEISLDRINNEINGMDRSNDSYSGNYSLKIGGDSLYGFTDLLYIAPCPQEPAPVTLTYWYKHSGSDADSLNIAVAIGESAQDMIDSQDPEVMGIYVQDTLWVQEEVSEWTMRQLEVQVMNDTLSLDSIVFIMVRDGYPDTSNYFLVDGFQWDYVSSVETPEDPAFISLGQSSDGLTIFPIIEPTSAFRSYSLWDINGRRVSPDIMEMPQFIDISHLSPGQYIFRIQTEHQNYSRLFVRY